MSRLADWRNVAAAEETIFTTMLDLHEVVLQMNDVLAPTLQIVTFGFVSCDGDLPLSLSLSSSLSHKRGFWVRCVSCLC